MVNVLEQPLLYSFGFSKRKKKMNKQKKCIKQWNTGRLDDSDKSIDNYVDK
jgi:hypothetical protein